MEKLLKDIVITSICLGGVKLYGTYKYYCGKCDANKMWQTIVEAQRNIMRDKG